MMHAKRVQQLLLALPLLIGSAMPALADEASVNQDIDELLGNHAKYQAVIVALQDAVAAHDAKGVAALVSYPIGVEINGRETNVKSPRAFEENYDGIITSSIADVITKQQYGDLFVNYQGIMFGSGEVWISGICHDDECKEFDAKVSTIQDTSNLK